MGDAFGADAEQPADKDYKPFSRLNERDPFKLLGLPKDASFEEVQTARNYLHDLYKWHEPSRESIELAFDSILQNKYKLRNKAGFRPPRTGRRGDAIGEEVRTVSWERRISALFDPTITTRTLINEGFIYFGLALWALFSSDQSFPLAGTFAYSVYMFQSKRIKRDPEGPWFGGNPMLGALLTTIINLGLACAAMTIVTAPLSALLATSTRQVGAFIVVLVMGLLGVYLK